MIDQRAVRFDTVQIIRHGVILVDHPSCKSGPAVGLSWDAQYFERIDLDEYEVTRLRRRQGRELILSSQEREERLRSRPSRRNKKHSPRRFSSSPPATRRTLHDIDECLSKLSDRLEKLKRSCACKGACECEKPATRRPRRTRRQSIS